MIALATIIRYSSGPVVPFTFFFWPAAGTVVGIYLFCHGFFLLQRKRLIMNTPVSKIRSAAMGLVEVSGLAAGPYTLTAPITGMPCYYYRTLIWQWKQHGKNSSWVKECDETLHVPFYLEDETGRLLVDPQGAELDMHRDFHDEFVGPAFFTEPTLPENVERFLLGHGISTDKKTKVEEYCIKPKNALFILGTLAENPGLDVTATPVRSIPQPSGSFGNSLASSMSLNEGVHLGLAMGINGGQATGPLSSPRSLDPARQAKIAAALTKAGISNPAAWATAGVSPAQPAMATAVASNGAAVAQASEQFDLHPPTVLMQGTHDRAFFISWRSQRDLVSSLGWKSGLMIWGGPALTLVSAYMLATMLGWL